MSGLIDQVWRMMDAEAFRAAREDELPEPLRRFLGRLCMLQDVPLHYLLPHALYVSATAAADSEGASPDVLRYFLVDRQWMYSLLDGALSVGGLSTGRREGVLAKAMGGHYLAEELRRTRREALREAVLGQVPPAEVDAELARRMEMMGLGDTGEADAWLLTGFVLRSRILETWSGTEVLALGTPTHDASDASDWRQLPLLRTERLGPDLMLCICQGVIRRVSIRQPAEHLRMAAPQAAGPEAKARRLPGVVALEGLATDSAGLARRLSTGGMHLNISLDLSFTANQAP